MRADLITNHDSATHRFYELVWPHTHDVLRTARILARDPMEADDLSQDTLLKAFRRIDGLQDGARVRPWLMAILRNTYIDRFRANRRHLLSLDELEYDPADTSPGSDETSHRSDPDAAMNELADETMIHALRRLPRDIRRTLLLVDVEGMQEAEAAQRLDIPLGTVKSRLHRGRNLLRDKLYPMVRDLHLTN